MATGILHLHSYFAYIALLMMIILIINSIMGLTSAKTYSETDRKIALFALVAFHIQIVIGLINYFTSPLGFSNLTGEVMKDSIGRLYGLEHPLINIIAVVIATIGYSKAKRSASSQYKFKTLLITFGLALVLVLSRIPWAAWP